MASGLAPVEGAVEYVECASACDVGRVVDGSWVGDCCGGGVAVGVWGPFEFFHTDGMYTYDYDQYDHVARALLDGHAWLDLDVPDALRDADNPYDVTTRQQLLADGVSPVYWDYAIF